ncbi:hypothetical protein E2C01_085190 [Portunus trituberculatus]|uniref:Uncharacterized protein n=1 Tax=Portunus trituberculatus TaxID=210409 RepID=A0A5B7J862_PORTR|nr:hypothetical protein [Portunus trituberculatus]
MDFALACKRLQAKAKSIYERPPKAEKEKKEYLIVPYSRQAQPITRLLERNGINIAYTAGRKLGDLVSAVSRNKEEAKDSIIYSIPCQGCTASYTAETSCGLKKRLYEHKYDLRRQATSNSLVVHVDSHGHLPDWGGARILHD